MIWLVYATVRQIKQRGEEEVTRKGGSLDWQWARNFRYSLSLSFSRKKKLTQIGDAANNKWDSCREKSIHKTPKNAPRCDRGKIERREKRAALSLPRKVV